MPNLTKEKLLLIDANSLIHRAYHALPPLTATDGQPAGALYGLASVLIKILKDDPPQYVAAAFDRPEPTLRKESYKEYKATRPPAPEPLVDQLQKAPDLFEAFGIKFFSLLGYEADDIIATIASELTKNIDLKIEILSGDLDLLQVVRGDDIVVHAPQGGLSNTVVYNEEGVRKRFGISPEKMADFKGLVGDTSDNIPGVPGIGPKGAIDLLNQYESLEDIYKNIATIREKKPAISAKLEDGRESATISKELAKLIKDVPISFSLGGLALEKPLSDSGAAKYLEGLGFRALVKRALETKTEANTLF